MCLFLLSMMPLGVTLGQEATEEAPQPVEVTPVPTEEVVTEAPVEEPTQIPTEVPTEVPTEAPTEIPTETPVEEPTAVSTEPATEEATEEPTVEITEEPSPVATEVPTNLFSDDFQDGDLAGWLADGWQVASEGDNIFLTSSQAGVLATVAGVDWPHLLFSARVRVNEGSTLLVNLRNGVAVSINAAGQVAVVVNGAVVAEGSPMGGADTWRQLNIQALGSTITVAVDRVVQLNAIAVGEAVSGALSFSSTAGTVALDDVVINKLDAPVIEPTVTPEIELDLNETERNLLQRAQTEGTVRVIVGLGGRYDLLSSQQSPSEDLVDNQFQLARQGRSVVLEGLNRAGGEVSVLAASQEWVIPFVAMEVDAQGLLYLFTAPEVSSVEEDILLQRQLTSSLPVIGAPTAHTYGYDGTGQVVAMLDDGIQANHELLAGKVVAEACFTFGYCPSGGDSQFGSGAAYPTQCVLDFGEDECSHGTHVAGIMVGNNTSYNAGEPQTGVAPDADIIAVNVFSASGASTFDIVSGLNWVYSQRNNYNIAAINMSLGASGFTGKCDVVSPSMVQITKSLRSAGITTVVASGNDGYVNGISFPACLSTVVSVGSTMDDDSISWFSNRANFLSLFAPGHFITSSVLTNAYSSYNGTSMAAPHVAGAYALLREAKPNASTSQMLKALQKTGVPITITGGKRIPRIDVADAIGNLLGKPKKLKLITPSNKAFTNETSITFEWQAAQGGVEYEIQISTLSNFSSINYTSTDTTLSRTVNSFTEGRWYWRVRSINLGGPGPWSSKWSFTVDLTDPGSTTLVSPADGASSSSRAVLKWTKALDAKYYRVQVDNNADFTSPEVDNSSIKSTSYKAPTLPPGTYYWRVLPLDEAGNDGGWTTARSFIIN